MAAVAHHLAVARRHPAPAPWPSLQDSSSAWKDFNRMYEGHQRRGQEAAKSRDAFLDAWLPRIGGSRSNKTLPKFIRAEHFPHIISTTGLTNLPLLTELPPGPDTPSAHSRSSVTPSERPLSYSQGVEHIYGIVRAPSDGRSPMRDPFKLSISKDALCQLSYNTAELRKDEERGRAEVGNWGERVDIAEAEPLSQDDLHLAGLLTSEAEHEGVEVEGVAVFEYTTGRGQDATVQKHFSVYSRQPPPTSSSYHPSAPISPVQLPVHPAPLAQPPNFPPAPYNHQPLPLPWMGPGGVGYQAHLVWDNGRAAAQYVNDVLAQGGFQLLAFVPTGIPGRVFILFYDEENGDLVPIYYQFAQGSSDFIETDLGLSHLMLTKIRNRHHVPSYLASLPPSMLSAIRARAEAVFRIRRTIIGRYTFVKRIIPWTTTERSAMSPLDLSFVEAMKAIIVRELAELHSSDEASLPSSPMVSQEAFDYTIRVFAARAKPKHRITQFAFTYLESHAGGLQDVPGSTGLTEVQRDYLTKATTLAGPCAASLPRRPDGNYPDVFFNSVGERLTPREILEGANGRLSDYLTYFPSWKPKKAEKSDWMIRALAKFMVQEGRCARTSVSLVWTDRAGPFQASIAHHLPKARRDPKDVSDGSWRFDALIFNALESDLRPENLHIVHDAACSASSLAFALALHFDRGVPEGYSPLAFAFPPTLFDSVFASDPLAHLVSALQKDFAALV